MSSPKKSLQPRSVQVSDSNESSANHADWDDEVATRSPKRVGVYDGNAPIADREEAPILQEHQCDIAAEIRGDLSGVICHHQNLLDTLTDSDKVIELINGESLVSVHPFIIYQYHVVKPKTLFRHIEKPHAHRTWPHHQAYELGENR